MFISGPIIGCTNEFVQVGFNSSNSVFFCKFLIEVSDLEKSCSIKYGLCDQEVTMTLLGYSIPENSKSVQLVLQNLTGETYCYLVTAKSETTVLQIEGNFIRKGAGQIIIRSRAS